MDTNFDIHKIIDDAMEKKDRYVTVYIGKHGTSVNVYPVDESKTMWIDFTLEPIVEGKMHTFHVNYKCSNCGRHSTTPSLYCPHCGEQMLGVRKEKQND